jgi:hypothetical protein
LRNGNGHFIKQLQNRHAGRIHPIRSGEHITTSLRHPRYERDNGSFYIDIIPLHIEPYTAQLLLGWALDIHTNDCSGLGATEVNETRPRKARAVVDASQL